MKPIKGFQGEYRWLSNFWPVTIFYEGIIYPSTEHAYQAAKTLNNQDRFIISNMLSPGRAKKAAKDLVLRSNWDLIKINVMLEIVREKFRNEYLRQKLLNTGNAYLEETNTWGDKFWGVCNEEGLNFLGFILMLVRHKIREKERKKQ
jgi:ribA/ribD-fused uncharacterized protein